MLRFTVLLALATICRAGSYFPYSYQSVSLYPTHSIKMWKSEAPKVVEEWTTPKAIKTEEWKPIEWKVPEEWKKPETKIEVPLEEWKTAEPAKIEDWKPEPVEWKEPEAPANYDFKYEVHDEHTGDIKRHSQTAVNGVVKGEYSLIDSDSFKRIVSYTADDYNGFQATVKREPTHFKVPIPEKKPTEAW